MTVNRQPSIINNPTFKILHIIGSINGAITGVQMVRILGVSYTLHGYTLRFDLEGG
ncbi:hypothetical protein [Calothrix sp. NIES-3974]|uniref:hypothetical protein n=1 Tax=Calothrix sp. NIES-3974 TaxID=2005462 RepID=UPI0012FDA9CC|nr:hypothetical protein [Calothrix sp. NIES-3974]